MSSDSGGEGDGTVERIDMPSKRRTLLQHGLPLPGLRYLSVAVLDDKLYIIWGWYQSKKKGRMAFSYAMYSCLVDHPTDPSAATWTLQPGKLNTPRYVHASIAFEGRMRVAGGGWR